MTGIICPSIFEYRALDKKALAKTGAQIILSGMGKLRAMHACAAFHRKHPDLERIFLIGFAGGLLGLKIGDVIEPDHFVEQDYNAEPFEKFPNQIRRKSKTRIAGSKKCVMLTQDRFLTENPYKNKPLTAKAKPIACDMESYAVARYCSEERIDFSVIKLISDAADENADHDFLKSCKQLSPKLNRIVNQAIQTA